MCAHVIGRHPVGYAVECLGQKPLHFNVRPQLRAVERLLDCGGDPARRHLLVASTVGGLVDQKDADGDQFSGPAGPRPRLALSPLAFTANPIPQVALFPELSASFGERGGCSINTA